MEFVDTTASYFDNMFPVVTDSAPCTDADNPELYKKELKGMMMCTPQTVGSTMGAGSLMGVNDLGVGPKAFLFSSHIDSIGAGGLIIDDVWNAGVSSLLILKGCLETSASPSRSAKR